MSDKDEHANLARFNAKRMRPAASLLKVASGQRPHLMVT